MTGMCPKCGRLVKAVEVINDGHVFVEKICPEHGTSKAMVSSDAEYWKWSAKYDRPGTKPFKWTSEKYKGCPNDCGICPSHKQHTCIGIIEITGQCNLKCNVCFAEAPYGDHLSFTQIADMINQYVSCETEPEILQLSGGEPTLHPELIEIVRYGKSLGIEDVAISTNGLKLLEEEYVVELAQIDPVIYLQFDTLRPDVSMELRGRDLTDIKKAAVEVCNRSGMTTVLVPTLAKGLNDNEIGNLIDYALAQPRVFGVNFQPVSLTGRITTSHPLQTLSVPEILDLVEAQTESRIEATDFRPIPCPHPHCTAINYILVENGAVTPLTDLVDVDEYMDYAENRTLVSEKILLNNAFEKLFSTRAVPGSESNLEAFCNACGMSLPEVLKKSVKSISVHSFMDRNTYQLERAQKCCIHVIRPDGKLVPFCNYNLIHNRRRG
ncbi:MAG: radical SAM protein [Candidatus Thorarchaeota archaeon]